MKKIIFVIAVLAAAKLFAAPNPELDENGMVIETAE